MAQIKDEKQYKAMMARIDELFFETDENTPSDDPRLQELDVLSALVEEYEQENSGDFWDTSSDDLFYHNRGYAFALWQITKTLSADYKDLILDMNVYPEWTYFVSSLKRAAEMKPIIIRNGAPTSVFVPNHLIMQNYYLLRALTAAEKIRNGLIREEYVRQN